jgi:hypothetical protein
LSKEKKVLKPINGLVYGRIVNGTSTLGFGEPHFGFLLCNVKDLIGSLVSKIILYIHNNYVNMYGHFLIMFENLTCDEKKKKKLHELYLGMDIILLGLMYAYL